MRIVVLIKQVPDTWAERRLDPQSGLVDRDAVDRVIDEIDERALEVALAHRDANKSAGADAVEVVVLSMGPADTADALRKALSMGADAAVHVLDDALVGADAARTAAALAAALRSTGYDLILAGNISTDGNGGIVPAMVAEHLGVPALSSFDTIELSSAQVAGERTTEAGYTRAHAPLPALVTVTERAPEARFPSLKGVMTAKRKPVTVLTCADLGLGAPTARSVVLSTAERAPRTAGIIIRDEGDAGVRLADFLTAERLI